jgi:RND superfamily putative drug exporter
MLAALTFLPAVLLLPGRTSSGEHGRWIFWPGIPHVGTAGPEATGRWARVSRLVGEHPRRVWVLTGLGLLALTAFLPTFKAEGIKQSDIFLTKVESVTGDQQLGKHFPAGSGSPTIVIGPADQLADLVTVVGSTSGVASAFSTSDQPVDPTTVAAGGPPPAPMVVDGLVEIQVTLSDPADSPAADGTVRALRTSLDKVSPDALVGGVTAANLDVREISAADRNRIIPVVLLVIFVVLALLLRALVAPIVLIIANVLSFGATLGASALVFNHLFKFPGADPGIPLYGFVFLVALGIDYSIFLMTRVREESQRSGTRTGILVGLAVTGGVITSAGVVLAATFAALGVLPILFLAQIAFIVAFGVLLDTLIVRSLLVPALSYDLGSKIWLPSRLARRAAAERVADPAPAGSAAL